MLATSLKFAIKTGMTTRQAVSSESCCSECLRYKGELAVDSVLDGILEVQVPKWKRQEICTAAASLQIKMVLAPWPLICVCRARRNRSELKASIDEICQTL